MVRKDVEDRIVEEFDYDFIPDDAEARDRFFRSLNPIDAVEDDELDLILNGNDIESATGMALWEEFAEALVGRIYARWLRLHSPR
jgi:hypothetical protein